MATPGSTVSCPETSPMDLSRLKDLESAPKSDFERLWGFEGLGRPPGAADSGSGIGS